MKNRLVTYFILLFILLVQIGYSQPWTESPYLQINGPQDEWKATNIFEIQKAFEAYKKDFKGKTKNDFLPDEDEWETKNDEVPGELQYNRWFHEMYPRVYPSGDLNLIMKTYPNFQDYLQANKNSKNQSQVATGNWTSLGPTVTNNGTGKPYIGRVNFVRVNPLDTNILWAGSASGGLWKSTNHGSNWTPMTDFLPVISCSDLVIDPTNTNIMYLATGDADGTSNTIGVFKSIDGGVTWNASGLTITFDNYKVYRIVMNPNNPNSLLAGTTKGLFITLDGGATWTLNSSVSTIIKDIEFKPNDPSVVYTISNSGRFYRSADSGATFTLDTTGLPSGNGNFRLAVTPANPSCVYCLKYYNFTYKGLYCSLDAGNSFTLRSDTPNVIGDQGGYDLALAVNPSNENDVYIGGLVPLRSIDGGVSWGLVNPMNRHVDIHSIDFMPGSSTSIFCCSDGGISKSIDNCFSPWIDLSDGLIITEVYCISTSATDPSLMLEGAQDNGTVRLNASGNKTVGGGDGTESFIDFVNPDIIYLSSATGEFYKTTTGTTTCSYSGPFVTTTGTGVNEPGGWITPFTMNPQNHNTILIGKHALYRSYDGGSTWSDLTGVIYGLYFLAYAPSDTNYIYAGHYRHLYVSTDGLNFVDKITSLPDTIRHMSSLTVSDTDPRKIWLCYNSSYTPSRVYQSNDAGDSWTDISAGLPNIPANSIVYQNGSNDGIYVGMDLGVYYRDASSPTWQLMNTGLPNVKVSELEIQYSSQKIRAGTYGRGVWESDLLVTGIKNPHSPDYGLLVYPNLVHENFTVSINGNWPEENSLSILDVCGRKVFSKKMNSKLEYVNFINLNPGVYFVQVEGGLNRSVKKIVVQ